MSENLKRTTLWSTHQKLGARLIDFGGWEMPVQYSGIVEEHLTVRKAAGLFDICHMGEFFVSGIAALDFLNSVLTNDLRKCDVGRGQYTLMCNDDGGVVDDLYVYRIETNNYLLIVNASRIEADFAWLQKLLSLYSRRGDVQLINASDRFGAIAVQGPTVALFIDSCFSRPPLAGMEVQSPSLLKKNEISSFVFNGNPIWVARTGYTGEDGFEVVADSTSIERIWSSIMEAGQSHGLKPCGLGARDTLRTEMCYPLYGHELSESGTPIEAGLQFFVSFDKGDFTGRAKLEHQKVAGPSKKCVAFKMTGRTPPPRPDYAIFDETGLKKIGQVVSGTQSPSLGMGIGLGYIPAELAKVGTNLNIEIRGKMSPAVTVAKPIYRKAV